MIKRPPNLRDQMLAPATHAERLVVAERITREVLIDMAPGKVISDDLIQRIARVTLAAAEDNIRMELLTTRRE